MPHVSCYFCNVLFVNFRVRRVFRNIWNCTEYVYTCLYGVLIEHSEQIQCRRVLELLSNPHDWVFLSDLAACFAFQWLKAVKTHCDYLLVLWNRPDFLKLVFFKILENRNFNFPSAIENDRNWPKLPVGNIQSFPPTQKFQSKGEFS